MFINILNVKKLIIALLLFSILTSCSKHVESLEDRSINRWYAIIDGDWEKAYDFETPSYRNTYDLQRFKNSYGEAVVWNSIEFVSVEKISEDVSDVTLILNVTYNNVLPFGSTIKERWIFKDAQWWHVQEK